MLAVLYETPLEDAQLVTWAGVHMAHHRDIIRRIFEVYEVQLSEFPLDPINPSDMEGWLWKHQQMHAEMAAQLGIQGFDLTDVDWEDDEDLHNWINLNAQEHYQAGQILQLG